MDSKVLMVAWLNSSYLDLLSQAGLFCDRCALENRIFLQYEKDISNQGEHSERFIPGFGFWWLVQIG